MYKVYKKYYLPILTDHDDEIMAIFWSADKPLNAAEVVIRLGENLDLAVVQGTIKKLIYRELLTTVSPDSNETPGSRSYWPAISIYDYKAGKYIHRMEGITGEEFSMIHFLIALFANKREIRKMRELNELEKSLEERKRRILEERGKPR